jgi:hypothetical protein
LLRLEMDDDNDMLRFSEENNNNVW